MFTGLIQGLGEVLAVEPRGAETRLGIRPLFELRDVVIGESIAVNGACLTVETAGAGGGFTAYASAETMARTTLGGLRRGSRVNLERALAMGDRLGGHMVAGHVDCLARVESVSPAGESRQYRLGFPAEFGVYVVEKGSVALDGISLTINSCADTWLTVNVIPETQRQTTILHWAPGTAVNLETDVIGKYVARMLLAYSAKAPAGTTASSGITEDFLKKHGF